MNTSDETLFLQYAACHEREDLATPFYTLVLSEMTSDMVAACLEEPPEKLKNWAEAFGHRLLSLFLDKVAQGNVFLEEEITFNEEFIYYFLENEPDYDNLLTAEEASFAMSTQS